MLFVKIFFSIESILALKNLLAQIKLGSMNGDKPAVFRASNNISSGNKAKKI